MQRHRRHLPLLALIGAAAVIHGAAPAAQRGRAAASPTVQVRYPDPDIGVAALAAREKAQRDGVGAFKVDYDFQFTDRVAGSGIAFRHHIVDDAAIYYKPVHYDHGTGLAAADVDGDGLIDLYFVNQVGGSRLYRNTGGGRFRDITASAGVGLAARIGVAASFADIDNDGDQDLFVTTVREGNVLFENDGRGHFKDISRAAGVDHVGHSSAAVFFDYDHDGLLDLYLCNVGRYTNDNRRPDGAFVGLTDAFSGHLHADRAETAILYRNIGGNRFTDVTADSGLGDAGWSGDASVADLNGDGFPDLFALNMQGSDHYFENQGGRRFVDRTAELFPRTSWGAMGVKFFDYDNDGRPDLFITDMHSDMSVEVGPDREKLKSRIEWTKDFLQGDETRFIFGNSFFHNRGNGRFEEISDRLNVENYWPWGPSVGDLNADGWLDVFIASSMNYPWRYGINSLLLNNRGETFLDSEFLLGVEPRREGRTHTRWFDVDCSAPNMSGQQGCRGQTGKITVMATLGTRSSLMLDLDGDGDLDIVTNEFNSEPQVLISGLAGKRPVHWVGVTLAGRSSNRNGLGAAVRVSTGGRVLTQWHDGKSGYLSQSVLPLYFGLDQATSVDRIEVDWPSGKKQVVTEGLRANSTIRMTEPE
ncbi:MAG: CRTAC1 family protein [Acidobacteriota bacterium]